MVSRCSLSLLDWSVSTLTDRERSDEGDDCSDLLERFSTDASGGNSKTCPADLAPDWIRSLIMNPERAGARREAKKACKYS